jgi:flavin-dependent dehydrogenase
MEKYDVAIIGGGSAGLAALKQLSTLGKQAVLLEAGGKVGVKNISTKQRKGLQCRRYLRTKLCQ